MFPKYVLIQLVDDGMVTFLDAGTTPGELIDAEDGTKVARYKLVGTGVISDNGPVYVEDPSQA